MDEVQIFREMFSETYLPRSFLEQQWHALKDSDSAVPTGAAGGKGSFLFHAQPTKKKKTTQYHFTTTYRSSIKYHHKPIITEAVGSTDWITDQVFCS